MEKHDELAGWAQFFGAMLAIGLTWTLSHRETLEARKALATQRKQEAARELQELTRRREVLEAKYVTVQILAQRAADVVVVNRDLLRGQVGPVLADTARHAITDILAIETQFLMFPVHELEKPEGVHLVTALRSTLPATRSLFETVTGMGARLAPLTDKHFVPFDGYVQVFETTAIKLAELRNSL